METVSLLIACLAVGLMGFAIQRGGTCTVAAVEEVVLARRCTRLLALVEAALWVGAGLILLNVAGLLDMRPGGYAVEPGTVAGGIVLGLGAFVNGACMFGTVARIGSGEWAYLTTPLGFYLGSLAGLRLIAPIRRDDDALLFAAPVWLGLAGAALLILLLSMRAQRAAREDGGFGARLWSPHIATLVIGVSFLTALVTAGSWTYSDLLAGLARGMTDPLASRIILMLTLLAGAVVGGWTAGVTRLVAPEGLPMGRCLLGGALMGLGSVLTPGGNDGLVLVAMPLLWPYAWLAFGSMCAAIYLLLRHRRRA